MNSLKHLIRTPLQPIDHDKQMKTGKKVDEKIRRLLRDHQEPICEGCIHNYANQLAHACLNPEYKGGAPVRRRLTYDDIPESLSHCDEDTLELIDF